MIAIESDIFFEDPRQRLKLLMPVDAKVQDLVDRVATGAGLPASSIEFVRLNDGPSGF